MVAKREACPRESNRLRKVVLPEKEAFGAIVANVGEKSNPQEVADLILGPFYEMMGMSKRGWR